MNQTNRMAQHTFNTTAEQEEALVGVASNGGITVQELIDSQLTRFLPEVVNQWVQDKRNKVADAYEKAPEEKKAQFDTLVNEVKAIEEAKVEQANVDVPTK